MTTAVTIAMPTFNGARTVQGAIRSLLAQTYTDFELIISDDGSGDETPAIAEGMAQSDGRIRIMKQRRNIGAAQHFNDLFGLHRSKYFMWAAQDDLWHPTFIERTHELLETKPEAVAALTQIAFIDERDKVGWRIDGNMPATSSNIVERLRTIFNRCGWFALYGLMRSEVMARTQLYRRSFGGDVLFMAELMLHGPFAIVDAPLFAYRLPQHEKSPAEYQQAIDPNWPLSVEPFSELAREVLQIVRAHNLDQSTLRRTESMALQELAERNHNWRRRIAREHRSPEFDLLSISARTFALADWLECSLQREPSCLHLPARTLQV